MVNEMSPVLEAGGKKIVALGVLSLILANWLMLWYWSNILSKKTTES
jgi:hypothetical protein